MTTAPDVFFCTCGHREADHNLDETCPSCGTVIGGCGDQTCDRCACSQFRPRPLTDLDWERIYSSMGSEPA